MASAPRLHGNKNYEIRDYAKSRNWQGATALIEAHALTVAVGAGHMLETAFPGPRDAVHQPVFPVKAELLKLLVMVILIKLRKGKQRGRCIDIP